MKKYTVLLLRPDYMTDCYGTDTYLAHVEAVSVAQAKIDAQVEVRDSEQAPEDDDDDSWNDPDDYHVLFVAEGHLNDIKDAL